MSVTAAAWAPLIVTIIGWIVVGFIQFNSQKRLKALERKDTKADAVKDRQIAFLALLEKVERGFDPLTGSAIKERYNQYKPEIAHDAIKVEGDLHGKDKARFKNVIERMLGPECDPNNGIERIGHYGMMIVEVKNIVREQIDQSKEYTKIEVCNEFVRLGRLLKNFSRPDSRTELVFEECSEALRMSPLRLESKLTPIQIAKLNDAYEVLMDGVIQKMVEGEGGWPKDGKIGDEYIEDICMRNLHVACVLIMHPETHHDK